MALRTPANFLDENLQTHRGRRADAPRAKALKPSEKSGLQERKPLGDVTNKLPQNERPTRKPFTAPRSHEQTKKPINIFADRETTKCYDWAKDGVEGAHFTGNDSQKWDKDALDKRVKKKVAKAITSVHYWSDGVSDPVMFPAKEEVAKLFEEVKGLELEPEILPDINIHCSGNKAKLGENPLTDDELDQYPFLDDKPVVFELRDGPAIPKLVMH